MKPAILAVLASLLALGGCSSVPGDAAFRSGHAEQAVKIYEAEYLAGSSEAGLRLAALLSSDLGIPRNDQRAFSIWREMADSGDLTASYNLGVAYENGIGTSVDYALAEKYYRKAGDGGIAVSLFNLGALYSNKRAVRGDDVAGLAFLLKAQQLATNSSETHRAIREDSLGHIQKIKSRMTPDQISKAEALAAQLKNSPLG
jgi:TPR repeat protein